ncbi:MAG: hypothetical protein SGILL_001888, partial [Bacillariaceae sp.]
AMGATPKSTSAMLTADTGVENSPDSLIHQAKLADDKLSLYTKLFTGAAAAGNAEPPTTAPVYLPSLSILANSVFGRLSGVPPQTAKAWADALVLQYDDSDEDSNKTWPTSEEDVLKEAPATMKETAGETTAALLKRLLEKGQKAAAMQAGNQNAGKTGFKRLKSRGLHCAVVSTAQVDMEQRARALSSWLAEISSAHPAAAVLVVDALLQIRTTNDLGGIPVWQEARSIPTWIAPGETDEATVCRRRFQAFPPHLASSYVTSDEAEMLHGLAMDLNAKAFVELTGTDPEFYSSVPYRLPSEKYRKSPHALWGTLPSLYNDPVAKENKHPLLALLTSGQWNMEALTTKNDLTETVFVVDTDLRKQQEADRITSSVFPHKLPGLYLVSGIGTVHMILNNTATGDDNDSHENIQTTNESLLPALTYVAGEHPLMTLLPAAPDDGFLDSRSTRHKRLPHLLRDLEYVIETPGTAMRLLLPNEFPAYQGISLSSRGEEILTFCTVWSRLLRLAQGMDPQKRKISGGHVEYEQNRWLEAFGLSLNFAGTRDALAESPTNSSSATLAPVSDDGSHLVSIREAMGNIMAALLREMKMWLYREGMLETGLPVPPGGAHGANDLSQAEALQRSTLHVAASQLGASAGSEGQSSPTNVSTVALSCATTVKMTEAQLDLIESALRFEGAQRQFNSGGLLREGGSNALAGMALNYSNAPLCRSFRDLDLTLVQLSAAGMSVGLGARRVFSLLISRFSMDGYLCDPERRSATGTSGSGYSTGLGAWVNPPRLQDPDHATVLSESFFATLCILVTELPPPPPISSSDETWLRQSIRRELIHALAAEPRSHSAAMTAASCAVGRRDESDGSAGTSGGGGLFRDVFAQVLKEVGKQKNQGSRAAAGPASFELSPSCCDEYDPTFFHLRRQEHQHAMDVVASLRKQKLAKEKKENPGSEGYCFPLPMDAAIRRSLLFALLGGSWLPPPDPVRKDDNANEIPSSLSADAGLSISVSTETAAGDVPVMTFSRRAGGTGSKNFPHKRGSSFQEGDSGPPFSADIVAGSSVSFLEVLLLLTLQVHTLEECASLHRLQSDLDEEAKSLSAGLSINSYLGRLVRVPESLTDVWALRPFPDGPLKSKGTGEERGSILGLLIALYEHRADHGAGPSGSQDETGGDGHGGAKSLTANGLKWILRFVNALIDGAPSVAAAVKSATTGSPIKTPVSPRTSSGDSGGSTIWTIDDKVRVKISGMLSNLPDLWPKPMDASLEKESSANKEKKEKGKAAQQRMLAMMRKKQSAFVESMGTSESGGDEKQTNAEDEEELCIICRCDDADGENNGPLGYLGHVQRSRVAQMRACSEAISKANDGVENFSVFQRYRVVGHMGCQVRETEAMDSRPVFCLPRGSIVSVSKSTVSDNYDILSRRVFVKHTSEEDSTVVEGWASVQSSQGYIILSPLATLCYENTRWGSTRPIIRQCGHAAHLKCVETHTLSLHQRAAGEQPYDGRFAANIDDGEFLCPLCKQLSNILIPRDGCASVKTAVEEGDSSNEVAKVNSNSVEDRLQDLLTRGSYMGKKESDEHSEIGHKALADFGSHLLQAMAVPWERSSGSRKRKHRRWHPSIQRWDYEEEDDDLASEAPTTVKNVLRLFRQQHISWAAVGHSAAAAEAAVRGIEEVLPFGSFSKTDEPWPGYEIGKDGNPFVQELTRIMTGSSGLLRVLMFEMIVQLGENVPDAWAGTKPSAITRCLADILCGRNWTNGIEAALRGALDVTDRERLTLWSQITTLMSSMPCHVARDGMLSQRHEARAAAAEMWVSRGLSTQSDASGEPPVPLAIEQLYQATPRPPEMSADWGTLAPTANDTAPEKTPFRPAVATAFLYMPLLSWDLNTLAGAVFSSLLTNENGHLPDCEDILNCGRMLVAGRMIQSLVTPHGFDSIDGMEIDEEDEEGRWDPSEMEKESAALSKLFSHCNARIQVGCLDSDCSMKSSTTEVSSPANLFGNKGASTDEADSPLALSPSYKILESVLNGAETMTTNDGMFILKEMQAPMPSAVIETTGEWWPLVNRWLTAIICLEKHHGSRGKSILPNLLSPPKGNGSESDDKMDVAGVNSKDSTGGASGAKNNQPLPSKATKPPSAMNEARGGELNQHGMLMPRRFFNDNIGDESDEELHVEDMDMDDAEEIIDFADQVAAGNVGANGNEGEESADEPSTSGSETGESNDTTHLFAGVGQSPIVSYQPSLLAQSSIGPGKQGSMFESIAASSVMADFSHLGLSHRKDTPTFSLIRLPKSFVELYGIVNKVKGRDESSTLDEAEDVGSTETAICLLTGACTVLLMHNNKSAYSASIFVDEHGEEDPGLRRGRPLFLNDARYRALEKLWRQQGIPREVAQIRSTSDRVIRDNWY